MQNWIKRWQDKTTGWHQTAVNVRLKQWLPALKLTQSATIFVPLCGKSVDMLYLLDQGYQVVGVELSELAVLDFFKDNKIEFTKSQATRFMVYQSKGGLKNTGIKIFVGDFFQLTTHDLAQVNSVYDRASLIALPKQTRHQYAQHLIKHLPSEVRILLLSLNYPQAQKSGPPFAVSEVEVEQLFVPTFNCTHLSKVDDLGNEPKFIEAGVNYLEKSCYLLERQ